MSVIIKKLNLKNCPTTEFAVFLNMVREGKGDEALDRLLISKTVENIIERGELHFYLGKRFLMYLGMFKNNRLIAIGAIKYYPRGVKIWVKEDAGTITPKGILEFGLAKRTNLAIGEDSLHLVSLPEYFEIGNTAVLPEERGKGFNTLLHKERITILQQWHQYYGSNIPSNLLITSTGILQNQLGVFNKDIDFDNTKFILRNFVFDDIWFNLGMVRKVSLASAHLARKLGLMEVGFAKSSGGLVFWTNCLHKISI